MLSIGDIPLVKVKILPLFCLILNLMLLASLLNFS